MIIIENKDQSVEINLNDGEKKTFLPSFNLEHSRELQSQFNEYIVNSNLNEKWKYNIYYIFPAIQETLFWQFFVYLVAHEKALKFIFSKDEEIIFNTHPYYTVSGVKRVYDYIGRYKKNNIFKNLIYNTLSSTLQAISKNEQILVVDDGINGFRFKFLKDTISKYTNYTRVDKPNKPNLFNNQKLFDTFWIGRKSIIYKEQDLMINYVKLKFLNKYLSNSNINNLIKSLDFYIQNIIAETISTTKYLKNKNVKKVISNDNIENMISLVIACKINEIEYISYEHGIYTRYQSGALGYNIDNKYNNIIPDKLIVWGEYCKNILLQYSNKYNSSNIFVGTFRNGNKKVKFIENKTHSNKSITVLYPYEFLTNTHTVSDYLMKMIKANWEVIIKVRPKGSGDLDSDIMSFPEEVRKNIKFTDTISDDDIVNKIDIVVGTQTTYILEMIPFNKPIWVLDTDFTYLVDFVDLKILPKIDLNKLEQIITDKKILSKYLQPTYSQMFFNELFADNDYEAIIKGLLK